jgi:hypothetical protein
VKTERTVITAQMTAAAERMDRDTVALVAHVTIIAATRSKTGVIGPVKAVLPRVTAMVFVKKEKIATTARTTADPRIIILVMAVSAASVDNVEIVVAVPSHLRRNGCVREVRHQPQMTTRAIRTTSVNAAKIATRVPTIALEATATVVSEGSVQRSGAPSKTFFVSSNVNSDALPGVRRTP